MSPSEFKTCHFLLYPVLLRKQVVVSTHFSLWISFCCTWELVESFLCLWGYEIPCGQYFINPVFQSIWQLNNWLFISKHCLLIYCLISSFHLCLFLSTEISFIRWIWTPWVFPLSLEIPLSNILWQMQHYLVTKPFYFSSKHNKMSSPNIHLCNQGPYGWVLDDAQSTELCVSLSLQVDVKHPLFQLPSSLFLHLRADRSQCNLEARGWWEQDGRRLSFWVRVRKELSGSVDFLLLSTWF